jgi:tetratricopeptide (TPR) repeat protein
MPGKSMNMNKARLTFLMGLMLAVITLAIYWKVAHHEFINLDDPSFVTENIHVSTGLTLKNIIWAATPEPGVGWFPVTWLSHMADVQMFGLNPRWHHLENVFIHIAATVLLFIFLFRLTNGLWRSAFVAAIFAVHPLHVESVAWIAERRDVLSAFFGYLTLLLYSEYVIRRRRALYYFSLLPFVAGLMSKPILVTLPIIMLLVDFWRFVDNNLTGTSLKAISPRIWLLFLKDKIPFFVFSTISVIITVTLPTDTNVMVSRLIPIPLTVRLENAVNAYPTYLAKIFWPTDLSVFYPFPSAAPLWHVIGSSLILISITVAVIMHGRHHPYLLTGWSWFLVMLVPVLGIIPIGDHVIADRYTYLSMTGILIMVAWGFDSLTKTIRHQKLIVALIAGSVVFGSAWATCHQINYWHDSISLFNHAITVTSHNDIAHINLGDVFLEKGNIDSAITEYQEALKISPGNYFAHNGLGVAFHKNGNLDAAIKEYNEALKINPVYSDAKTNLSIAIENKNAVK